MTHLILLSIGLYFNLAKQAARVMTFVERVKISR